MIRLVGKFFIFINIIQGTKSILIINKIITYCLQIIIKFFGMFHPIFSNFCYKGIFSEYSPSSSSSDYGTTEPGIFYNLFNFIFCEWIIYMLKIPCRNKINFSTAAIAICKASSVRSSML